MTIHTSNLIYIILYYTLIDVYRLYYSYYYTSYSHVNTLYTGSSYLVRVRS